MLSKSLVSAILGRNVAGTLDQIWNEAENPRSRHQLLGCFKAVVEATVPSTSTHGSSKPHLAALLVKLAVVLAYLETRTALLGKSIHRWDARVARIHPLALWQALCDNGSRLCDR